MRALVFVLCAACGSAATQPVESAISTDRDPLPYVPPPTPEAQTGGPSALAASGGEDQARRVVPAFLEAIRDGDEAELTGILAEQIDYVIAEPRHTPRSRESIVQRILVSAHRNAIPSELGAGDLIDLGALAISRAGAFWRGRTMPPEVRPTDVVVEVPILEPGRIQLRILLAWHLRATLVVRPGAPPRIVAF